jgi:murein L,D-transpeptidase YafK
MNITRRRGTIAAFIAAILCAGHKNTISAQPNVAVDSLVISKSAHTLCLMSGKTVLKTYHVALGRGSAGAKQVAWDNRTPEGKYIIDEKKSSSSFHKALHISYPSAEDRARAVKLGKSPGGDIEIHGLPTTFAWLGTTQHFVDWTAGCIALSNDEIDEVWEMVSVGTPVEIAP